MDLEQPALAQPPMIRTYSHPCYGDDSINLCAALSAAMHGQPGSITARDEEAALAWFCAKFVAKEVLLREAARK